MCSTEATKQHSEQVITHHHKQQEDSSCGEQRYGRARNSGFGEIPTQQTAVSAPATITEFAEQKREHIQSVGARWYFPVSQPHVRETTHQHEQRNFTHSKPGGT